MHSEAQNHQIPCSLSFLLVHEPVDQWRGAGGKKSFRAGDLLPLVLSDPDDPIRILFAMFSLPFPLSCLLVKTNKQMNKWISYAAITGRIFKNK